MRRRQVAILAALAAAVVACMCALCCGLFVLTPASPSYYATRTARSVASATESARPTDTSTRAGTPDSTHAPTAAGTPTAVPSPTATLVPTDAPTPTHTPTTIPSPAPTRALVSPTRPASMPSASESEVKSGLEWALRTYPQVTLLGVNITGRDLVIEVAIERTDLGEFFEALGAIHGAVAELEPDVERVAIDDVTGQRIVVRMTDLAAHYRGQTTFDEFRDTWQVINP